MLFLSVISAEGGIPLNCMNGNFDKILVDTYSPIIKNKLPVSKALIPYSLEGRIAKTKKILQKKQGNQLDCNTTQLCASFDVNTTPNTVSSWMGFEYKKDTEQYFIATYGQKSTYLGNNIYSTEKWNKKHFWMHIGKDVVPFPIQPRFVGIDEESNNEWYAVDYIGYRMAGSDYSNYWENMSESVLILLINPQTKKVLEYYIEYYDENDEYVGDYDIEIGDEIESYFLAFKKGQEEATYLFSLEDITHVTDSITFSYEEQYPKRDFNCTRCEDLNLADVEFKYIFESYGKTRSTFTEPQSIEKTTNVTTTKSVSLFNVWILFFLLPLISIFQTLQYKKDEKC
jgi:hypothetical protein